MQPLLETTITICHAKTHNLAQRTILAVILIVAASQPGLIVPQMVKERAIVIDVGIDRLEDGRIVGDVDFYGVMKKAYWITRTHARETSRQRDVGKEVGARV